MPRGCREVGTGHDFLSGDDLRERIVLINKLYEEKYLEYFKGPHYFEFGKERDVLNCVSGLAEAVKKPCLEAWRRVSGEKRGMIDQQMPGKKLRFGAVGIDGVLPGGRIGVGICLFSLETSVIENSFSNALCPLEGMFS